MKRLCEVLELKRSSYYKWLSGRQARAAGKHRDRALAEKIREVHGEFGGTYGSPRVTAELREKGLPVNEKRAPWVMWAFFICVRPHRRVHPLDLLQRDFTAPEPGWEIHGGHHLPPADGRGVSLPCDRPGLLFSHRAVGWSIADDVRTDLVVDVLRTDARTRGGLDGSLFYSDHGAQYGSRAFADLCT